MNQKLEDRAPILAPKVPDHNPETHGLLGTPLASRRMAAAMEPTQITEYPKHIEVHGKTVEVNSKEEEMKALAAVTPPVPPDDPKHRKEHK